MPKPPTQLAALDCPFCAKSPCVGLAAHLRALTTLTLAEGDLAPRLLKARRRAIMQHAKAALQIIESEFAAVAQKLDAGAWRDNEDRERLSHALDTLGWALGLDGYTKPTEASA